MKSRLIFNLFIIFFLSGCSLLGSDKDTKKLVADGLTPKELYQLAEDKVDSGLIEQAIDQYEQILASYPNSKYAVQARIDIAYNLFKQKKYNRAITELDKFIERFPNIAPTPYAYYLRGVVAESKSNSILDKVVTDNAQRDVASVKDAYNYYVMLIETFPDSKYSTEAKNKLENLTNILAKHELYIALYYNRIGAYIASVNRSKFIIENYPNTTSIADALYLMSLGYDKLNTDQLAEDTRKILYATYPEYLPSFSTE